MYRVKRHIAVNAPADKVFNYLINQIAVAQANVA